MTEQKVEKAKKEFPKKKAAGCALWLIAIPVMIAACTMGGEKVEPTPLQMSAKQTTEGVQVTVKNTTKKQIKDQLQIYNEDGHQYAARQLVDIKPNESQVLTFKDNEYELNKSWYVAVTEENTTSKVKYESAEFKIK